MAFLEVENCSLSFGGLKAVSGFNLRLDPGQLIGLIGPNGAGKTTVFNLITGVYAPQQGDVRVDGRSVMGFPPFRITRRGIARTFQGIRLFPNLTAFDNVLVGHNHRSRQGLLGAVAGTLGAQTAHGRVERECRRLLEMVGLADQADVLARSLPYGSQRRLEIARALATRPRILCLDEPAAGMNPTEKRELMEMIRRIRDQFSGGGLTILLIEHDMKVIMGICERILVLDYGKTIATGTPEEIRNNPAVIEAYLGASAKHS